MESGKTAETRAPTEPTISCVYRQLVGKDIQERIALIPNHIFVFEQTAPHNVPFLEFSEDQVYTDLTVHVSREWYEFYRLCLEGDRFRGKLMKELAKPMYGFCVEPMIQSYILNPFTVRWTPRELTAAPVVPAIVQQTAAPSTPAIKTMSDEKEASPITNDEQTHLVNCTKSVLTTCQRHIALLRDQQTKMNQAHDAQIKLAQDMQKLAAQSYDQAVSNIQMAVHDLSQRMLKLQSIPPLSVTAAVAASSSPLPPASLK